LRGGETKKKLNLPKELINKERKAKKSLLRPSVKKKSVNGCLGARGGIENERPGGRQKTDLLSEGMWQGEKWDWATYKGPQGRI